MSAATASCAARLISAGAGKSGKPCERLTALFAMARRVISRITDSVNSATLCDSSNLVAASIGCGFAGFIRFPVKLSINFGVARNQFHVLARLGERNRIDELGRLAIRLPGGPLRDARFPSIVRGQRRFVRAITFAEAGVVDGADANVEIGIDEKR